LKTFNFLLSAGLLPLIVLIALLPVQAETETVIRAGITREITDFDSGSTSTVLRGGASFTIDDIYRFNLTSMHNRNTDESTSTWYIHGSPCGESFSFILGSYALHFGSGLIMGKKEFIKPDPFSRRFSFSRENIFTGSQSGNPASSFFGIASTIISGDEDLNLRLAPFCSIQRRFISEEQAANGAVSSSLLTVNLKTTPEGKYVSPVDIINTGAVADMAFIKLFHIQAFGFTTTFRSACDERLLWEQSAASNGTARAVSGGIFAEYSDSSISIFAEPVFTIRSGPGWQKEGDCISCGITLRNEIFRTSLSGKFSDRNFKSIYATGDSGPENLVDFSVSIIHWKHFNTGVSFYSERDLTVNPGSDERRCFIREDAAASITGFDFFGADLKFSRKVPLNGERSDRSRQFSTIINLTPPGNLYLRARYTGQFCDTGVSWFWGAELKMMIFNCFSLSCGYTEIHAIKDNALYAVITPASENNMDIARFTGKGNGWSARIRYTGDKNSFFFRWCRIRNGGESRQDMESALVLIF